MKSRIFLYLFIFACLFILFQFMNAKKAKESYDAKIANLKNKVEQKEVAIDSLINVNMDLTYFTLDSNEDAVSYFEEMGYDANKLALTISDQIISQNKADADNPIIPFDGMEGHMLSLIHI